MSPNLEDWRAWVGRSEESGDTIDPLRARAMQAALDDPSPPLDPGDALPPLWHWLYFWTVAPEAALGPDGHAARGGFLPPIDLPRRMWAGSRVSFPRPLPIGARATRRSEIAEVSLKEGRSGALAFAATVRGHAAFGAPDIYEFLESEGFLYAIRLPKNQILQESIAHVLTRAVGRPPNHVRRYYASFRYQAGSWDRKRRVVAKVEWHPGELCPRVGFIVTNLSWPAERVVAFYNHRGTAEQTTLREKLVKIGAKVVRHGRYVTFQLAEVAVSKILFQKILALIDDLRRSPVPA